MRCQRVNSPPLIAHNDIGGAVKRGRGTPPLTLSHLIHGPKLPGVLHPWLNRSGGGGLEGGVCVLLLLPLSLSTQNVRTAVDNHTIRENKRKKGKERREERGERREKKREKKEREITHIHALTKKRKKRTIKVSEREGEKNMKALERKRKREREKEHTDAYTPTHTPTQRHIHRYMHMRV